MENNNEQKRKTLRGPRIRPMASRDAGPGIITARRNYIAASWSVALIHIEQIILRGNAVRSVNVGGSFKITELVIS